MLAVNMLAGVALGKLAKSGGDIVRNTNCLYSGSTSRRFFQQKIFGVYIIHCCVMYEI